MSIISFEKDFFVEVIKGNVSGHSMVNKFGYNLSIDTGSVPEDVWNGGGLYAAFNATAAEIVEVFSSDAADDSAGTGARTVDLFGLDGSYNETSETVILDGVTPVNTVNSYLRLDRAIVITAGTGGSNAGVITARQSVTTANVFTAIPISRNQTNIAAYTIPAGKTGYLYSLGVTVSKATDTEAQFDLFVRPFGEVFQGKDPGVASKAGGQYIRNTHPWLEITEKSDIVVRVSSVGANGTQVDANFAILLVDN
jgi:hypothetical protein